MIPIVLVAGLALGSTAFAATSPPSHPIAKPVASGSVATTKTASSQKQKACDKTWQSQKTHVGTRKAFMQTCVAKG